MKSTANITPATANAGRLLKFDLATLQFAYDSLRQESGGGALVLENTEQGVRAVLELRQSIAIKKLGDQRFASVQALAEALLQVTVCDGVGLPYDEILCIVRMQFKGVETSMNCIRWYASRMQKGDKAVVLPPRPASTSAASA